MERKQNIHRLVQTTIFVILSLAFILWGQDNFLPEASAQEHIRLIHWNDFHANNQARTLKDSSGEYLSGGASILKGAIELFRQDTIPVLVIEAGDEFQGSPICSITRGASQIMLLNLIHPDLFTPGNHDFDYGKGRLDSLLIDINFPVICSNLFDNEKGALFLPAYRIVPVGKVRIGFLGLITPGLSQLVIRERITKLSVLDPEKVVRKYTQTLRDSVDIFVAVSHMGIEEDRRLAEATNLIDIIVGGHSHTVIEKPELVNGVVIVQAGSNGRYLGALDLWVDTKKDTVVKYQGKLLPLDSRNYSPDAKVKAVVDSLEMIVNQELGKEIAVLRDDWLRESHDESNIGNWIADAYRSYTKSDIAFQNNGGIRKNLNKGPVTKRDLWEITPFGNSIVSFEVKGKELFTIMENNLDGRGEFLQVSGVKVLYDRNAQPGKRVKKIWVKGSSVKIKKTYIIATNNFVFDHFYDIFGIPPKDRNVKMYEKLDREVLIEAAQHQKIITSKIEGRLQVVR